MPILHAFEKTSWLIEMHIIKYYKYIYLLYIYLNRIASILAQALHFIEVSICYKDFYQYPV